MNQSKRLLRARKLVLIALFIASSLAILGRYFYACGQDKSGFPMASMRCKLPRIATK